MCDMAHECCISRNNRVPGTSDSTPLGGYMKCVAESHVAPVQVNGANAPFTCTGVAKWHTAWDPRSLPPVRLFVSPRCLFLWKGGLPWYVVCVSAESCHAMTA